MQVYRLTPIDPTDPDWQASYHRAEAFVRAASEDRARHLAAQVLGRATGREDRGAGDPWRRAGKVRAEPVDDPRHPAEGEEGVLEPKGRLGECRLSPGLA